MPAACGPGPDRRGPRPQGGLASQGTPRSPLLVVVGGSCDAVVLRVLAQVSAAHLRGTRGARQVVVVRGEQALDPRARPRAVRALLRLAEGQAVIVGGRRRGARVTDQRGSLDRVAEL